MGFFTKRYAGEVFPDDFPKKTDKSIYLGKVAERETQVFMDPRQLTKHVAIAGVTGGGKTVAGNVLLEGALSLGASALIIDPTAEWAGIIKPNTDPEAKARFSEFKLYNDDARGLATDILSLRQHKERVYDLQTIMTPGLATVVMTDGVSIAEIEQYICSLIQVIASKNLDPTKDLRLLIVFDEVHIILPKFGGSNNAFVQLERATREFRELGVGIVLLSQVLEDFMGSIRANVNTEVQMRTTYDLDLEKARMKYGEEVTDAIMRSQAGTGLFHNADYNIGRPFFLSFRPPYHGLGKLSPRELKEYFEIDKLIYERRDPSATRPARQKLRHGDLAAARELLNF